ncbi:DUF7344 domain-containing protein [Halalkalirubrum salinum]|uniref:DUF7344 domain-containing protein n=1 Tax=Halalkalirubrum salinum TaxID=2563889 RepID=UPI0010FB6886|nr:hypothetical protein [Halalkalirubrum salinum]
MSSSASVGDESKGGSIETDTAPSINDLLGPERDAQTDLEIGEVFEILKNDRRRMVIEYLKNQEDGCATLDVVAEHIAAIENGVDVSQISSSQRKRVYIGLYQCHLPKMDEYGVVDYEKSRGTIELKDISQFDRYLDTDAEPTNDGQAELAIAVGVSGIVLVGLSGIGPLTAVPSIAWTLVALSALLGLGIYR